MCEKRLQCIGIVFLSRTTKFSQSGGAIPQSYCIRDQTRESSLWAIALLRQSTTDWMDFRGFSRLFFLKDDMVIAGLEPVHLCDSTDCSRAQCHYRVLFDQTPNWTTWVFLRIEGRVCNNAQMRKGSVVWFIRSSERVDVLTSSSLPHYFVWEMPDVTECTWGVYRSSHSSCTSHLILEISYFPLQIVNTFFKIEHYTQKRIFSSKFW